MTDQTYNGWSNYETWNVSLWLNKEEPMYRAVQTLAARYPDHLADAIREYVIGFASVNEDHFGDLESRDEIDRVNWTEIAEAWVAE